MTNFFSTVDMRAKYTGWHGGGRGAIRRRVAWDFGDSRTTIRLCWPSLFEGWRLSQSACCIRSCGRNTSRMPRSSTSVMVAPLRSLGSLCSTRESYWLLAFDGECRMRSLFLSSVAALISHGGWNVEMIRAEFEGRFSVRSAYTLAFAWSGLSSLTGGSYGEYFEETEGGAGRGLCVMWEGRRDCAACVYSVHIFQIGLGAFSPTVGGYFELRRRGKNVDEGCVDGPSMRSMKSSSLLVGAYGTIATGESLKEKVCRRTRFWPWLVS
ncbi:hypothetical protein Salat_0033900 [Sesamum alatum]|uniref:Uncharacterized protein n=1 Tax=Sesamum alatum TaxID=300844 RepID=A0AAE2CWE9_9LAMI|nr:hypothetical protein Salat_0033900 [Sesamum alatum]